MNHKLFDKTTEEINNMIKEILDKLTGHVSVLINEFINVAINQNFIVFLLSQWKSFEL